MRTLGVNIDHVATIRQARKTIEPDPITAAALAEIGGADGITIHLREDRRHIQDRDLFLLKETIKSRINLEMATSNEIIKIALKVIPDQVTLVPEKRTEVTTEGGLDVIKSKSSLAKAISQLKKKNISISLFIDPDPKQIKMSAELGAEFIELHTGHYANAKGKKQDAELSKLMQGAQTALDYGLRVNAGHGLTYHNIQPILQLPGLEECNIGHSIISRAVFVGLSQAVKDMKEIIIRG